MPRATPNDPIPDRTKMVQLVDLEHHHSNQDGTLTRNHQEVSRGDQCYFASPMDYPAYLRFMRTIDKERTGSKATVNHHLSTTLEVDLYTAGTKVWVKWDIKKHQFVLMAQGPDDSKPRVIERFNAVGGKK